MEKDSIIEQCPQGLCNVPVATIVKPDCSIRFCCDYRGLNEVSPSLEMIIVFKSYKIQNGAMSRHKILILQVEIDESDFLYQVVNNGCGKDSTLVCVLYLLHSPASY